MKSVLSLWLKGLDIPLNRRVELHIFDWFGTELNSPTIIVTSQEFFRGI
jgi:hypothetical protein